MRHSLSKKQCSYILVRNDFQSWSNNGHPCVQSLPGTLVQLPYPRRSPVFVPEQKNQLHWLLEPPHLDTTATHPAFLLRLSALCSSSWLCIGSIDTFLGPYGPTWGNHDLCGDGLYQKSHHPQVKISNGAFLQQKHTEPPWCLGKFAQCSNQTHNKYMLCWFLPSS